jgi:hypothetical protein
VVLWISDHIFVSASRAWSNEATSRFLTAKNKNANVVRPYRQGGIVEWKIVAINFLYASLGVLLMYVSYRVIDLLTPHVDFPQELQRGNVAVAIFIGALFISIAVIIGGALN